MLGDNSMGRCQRRVSHTQQESSTSHRHVLTTTNHRLTKDTLSVRLDVCEGGEAGRVSKYRSLAVGRLACKVLDRSLTNCQRKDLV